ncbi:hypothetical protein AXF42_Ash018458 [Apostasia shenzhenica]|uniref:Uncharacterized protein n=1 Tax=Apostasia shenzhenica TaxID=1088818 RepID=A0A2I0BEG0_9ASPA|nr:hypothetical protein AXF42_Ash018458 [Apostasia shenzhenica]
MNFSSVNLVRERPRLVLQNLTLAFTRFGEANSREVFLEEKGKDWIIGGRKIELEVENRRIGR